MEGTSKDSANVETEAVACNLKTHEFSDKLMGVNVTFFVLKLKDSFFLWIGSKPTLTQLAVAMITPQSAIPAATNVFGDLSNSASQDLAIRLTKKTGKQVYASYNINETTLLPLIEKRLHEEMDSFPEKF